MEKSFLKSKYWLINHFLIVAIMEIITIISIILIYLKENNPVFLVYLLLLFIVILILSSTVLMLAPKTYLARISVSSKGVRWTLFKKLIMNIGWDEVTDVYIDYRFFRKCLVFKLTKSTPHVKDKEFYFNVDRMSIETIMKFCVNQSISAKIKQIIRDKSYQTHNILWMKNK